MSAKNDITGDSIRSKILSEKGRDEFDRIFKRGKYAESEDQKKADNSKKKNV